MSNFTTVWLPMLVGFVLGWFVTHLYSRSASKELQRRFDSLTAVLVKVEKAGTLKLDRDVKGNIADAHILTIDTGKFDLSVHPATLTVGAASPAAGTSIDIASSAAGTSKDIK
ncbi:MAG: hypothetical protein ACLQKH_15120 [Steroidobacteraceae bacterium]